MEKKLKFKKDFSSGGLVWDGRKRRVLMIKVKNLQGEVVWTFPKGHPDRGESPRQSALREVREETGWDCEIVKPFLDVRYKYVHRGTLFAKTVRWFLMRPLRKAGTFDPREILLSRWVSLKLARRRVRYPGDIRLLKKLAA